MKPLAYTLLAATLTLFNGCANQKPEQHEDQEEHVASAVVQLNNGNKWEANIETTQGIETLKQMVEVELAMSAPESITLKSKMLEEFTNILNRCTMKGEAHEQLHNYLLPLKADIEGLSEPATEAELTKIKNYLNTYYQFFI
ncbi:MAG TPA: hypothetical protein DIS90_04665 [Cytophagales bacterium]|nr:hypothetical protein [Cytophagales bacterium]